MNNKHERYPLIDTLKGIAIIFVIIIHTYCFGDRNPVYLLVLNTAVPMFLMLSGFVFALRFFSVKISEMYRFSVLKKTFLRVALPLLLSYGFYIILVFLRKEDVSVVGLLKRFLLAHFGLGAYYYFIVIQFALFAPLVLLIVKRYHEIGLLILASICFVWELFCHFIDFPESAYKVLVLRYLLAIGCGMYLYGCLKVWKKKIKPFLLVLMWVVGFVYVILPAFGYNYRIFSYPIWGKTAMMFCLYLFPMLYLVFLKFLEKSKEANNKFNKILGLLGKASLNIMCTQMIFFAYKATFIHHVYDYSTFGWPVVVCIDLIISILSGIAFYYVDTLLIHKSSGKNRD